MSGECFPPKESHMECIKGDEYKDLLIDLKSLKHSEQYEKNGLRKQGSTKFHKFHTDSKARITAKGSVVECNHKITNLQAHFENIARQNSFAICTDTSGAPLGTINKMLSGITESIRDADYFSHTKAKNAIPEVHSVPEVHGVEIVKIINVKPKTEERLISTKRSQIKIAIKNRSNTKVASSHLLKRKRHMVKTSEDKNIIYESQLGNVIVNSSIASLKVNKRILNKKQRTQFQSSSYARDRSARRPNNKDLVELYHNNAVKECNSSDNNLAKSNANRGEFKENRFRSASETVPPLAINDNNDNFTKIDLNTYSRNYEMPTISSRMKQVAKYYMNSFNIKSIPFCPAISTSASHNIGINIQQVMNMVKYRQPSQKLSPTIAYNIGLAADKWSNKPLSFLISNMPSKISSSQCPLTRNTLNYQQLQEVAKTIPEETLVEEEEIIETNSPETQSIIITGPSGDVKVHSRKQTVWTMNNEGTKCTCLPQKGLDFQEVLYKHNMVINRTPNNPPSNFNARNCKQNKMSDIPVKETNKITPLQGKEQKLKMVMNKLYEEFDGMNKKYEDLIQKANGGSKNINMEDIHRELDILNKELSNKEEEIVMVMTLYNEVLALKQQIKCLKERTSKEAISVKSQPSKFGGYESGTTTGLLNKLLHHIQHFQAHYKRN